MANRPADQNLIKRINSASVLGHLLASSPQSRANLAQLTGLTRSTISSLVSDLIDLRLIREVGLEDTTTRGRPGMLLELNPGGGCIVGFELNVDYLSVILTDFTAHTLWSRHVELDPHTGQEQVLALCEELIQLALRAGDAHRLKPLGIGLAVPGLVDTAKGTLVYAPNLNWRNVNFHDRWCAKFGMPLYVDNDGSIAALGEYYFGIARGCPNFLYLGTGVGLAGGLMLNGEIYRGAGGYAGEVGHMTVTTSDELCGCGRRGCWETLVGPRTVFRRIQQALDAGEPSLIPELAGRSQGRITMEVVVEAANRGDALALNTLADIAYHLGIGIVNLINLFNPEMIVLGGTLTPGGDYLMPTISRLIANDALREPSRMVALALSSQGSDACVKGAVALVIDGIVREPAASRSAG